MTGAEETSPIHASCVALGARGAILLGPSGSGKSALAVQALALGAELVSDDRLVLVSEGGDLRASAPSEISGLVEIRGVGLVRVSARLDVKVVLAVDLDRDTTGVRLPQPQEFCFKDACVPLIAGKSRSNLVYEVMACLRWGQDPLLLDPEQSIARDRNDGDG